MQFQNRCDGLFRGAALTSLLLVFGGCGALSLEEELKLGDEGVSEIASTTQLIDDIDIVAYIDDLASSLLAATPSTAHQINIRLIDSETFSAFTIAGGNIYLTTGAILACRNVSELASILSHEIAHVSLGHISDSYRRFRTSKMAASITGITLAIATGNPFIIGAGDFAANLGSSIFIGSHTRESEREADDLAFRVMQQAGYDPRSQLTLLGRIRASTLTLETLPPFLLTHPVPEERMASVEERLRNLPSNPSLRINDKGKLEAIQKRLL